MSLGDPVKRKRPRASDPPSLRGAPTAPSSNSTRPRPSASFLIPTPATSAPKLAAVSAPVPSIDAKALTLLPAPQVLALLSQLDLSTPQGIALLPAIQTLAQFYGIEIPTAQSSSPSILAPALGSPTDMNVEDLRVDSGIGSPVVKAAIPARKVKVVGGHVESTSKGKGKVKRGEAAKEQFNPVKIGDGASPAAGTPNEFAAGNEKKGGVSFPPGCANCRRKKSTVWRESTEEGEFGEAKKTVCNGMLSHGHVEAASSLTALIIDLQRVEFISTRMDIIDQSTIKLPQQLREKSSRK